MGDIYSIRNTVTGRTYIGQTNALEMLWRAHRGALNSGRHTNKALQWDWVFYGAAAFEFAVLETHDWIACCLDRYLLFRREQFFIAQHQPNVYNIPDDLHDRTPKRLRRPTP